ncbi:MAG: FeoB-associated Cys-rich membrane protein [Eubacteriales bacterium]
MLNWIANNIATILISLGLLLIVCAIIIKFVKDKKKGKSSCGCNCAHCAMAGSCHSNGRKKK